MYLKIFLNLILIVALIIGQLSFISSLPFGLNNFNFILVVLVFILMLSDFKMALWWAMGAGFLLDIYSFLPFGIYLISLFLTILVANFLLVNFFTDRSLDSFMALTFFSTLFYSLLFYLSAFSTGMLGKGVITFNQEFWLNLGIQLFLNLLFVFLFFYVISFVSKRLKPVFLDRSSRHL